MPSLPPAFDAATNQCRELLRPCPRDGARWLPKYDQAVHLTHAGASSALYASSLTESDENAVMSHSGAGWSDDEAARTPPGPPVSLVSATLATASWLVLII